MTTNDIIIKLNELLLLTRKTEGAENIQIVICALLGSIMSEIDGVLAEEVQKIIKEKLMPLVMAEKERVKEFNTLEKIIDKLRNKAEVKLIESPRHLIFDIKQIVRNNQN